MKLQPQSFVSRTPPEAARITPVTNEKFWKPVGGLWTSTLDEFGGQWVRWLTERYSLGDPRWGGKLWLLKPVEANIVVISNPTDLRELAAKYPQKLTVKEQRIRSFALLLDWEAIAQDYDGLHVPNPWPWRFGDDYEAGMFFYGMDAECTCWFRWCFEGEPEEIDTGPYIARCLEDEDVA